jgi:hypothetical protein
MLDTNMHGVFLGYYSDSKEERHGRKIYKAIYKNCYLETHALPMLSFPVNAFKITLTLFSTNIRETRRAALCPEKT